MQANKEQRQEKILSLLPVHGAKGARGMLLSTIAGKLRVHGTTARTDLSHLIRINRVIATKRGKSLLYWITKYPESKAVKKPPVNVLVGDIIKLQNERDEYRDALREIHDILAKLS